jgi:hypothetical protein
VLPWIRGARSWSQIIHMPLLWEGVGRPKHGDGYMAMGDLLLFVAYQSLADTRHIIQINAEEVREEVFASCVGVTQKYLVPQEPKSEEPTLRHIKSAIIIYSLLLGPPIYVCPSLSMSTASCTISSTISFAGLISPITPATWPIKNGISTSFPSSMSFASGTIPASVSFFDIVVILDAQRSATDN